MEANEELWNPLTNKSKLERDKGVAALEKEILNSKEQVVLFLRENVFKRDGGVKRIEEWETKIGHFQAAKVLVKVLNGSLGIDDINLYVSSSLFSLTDKEVRVRSEAAQLLGELCRYEGPKIYEMAQDKVIQLIRENLQRDDIGADEIRDHKSDIFHDTAGWKNLETSMKALQCMAEGCGKSFQAFVDEPLLDLVKEALQHTNRFVREAAFYTINSFITSGFTASESSTLADTLARAIRLGLNDNWSQVRLSASVACRNFFLSFGDLQTSRTYFKILIPPLCLNRYYMAEGVRIYCQDTWKMVLGDQGKATVEELIPEMVHFYTECTKADNHAVREAACQCIAELALKIDKQKMGPCVQELLDFLLTCFQDDSWPVRDMACVACGHYIVAFPAECKSKVAPLFPLFLDNLKDPISSVRQGGAQALANVVSAYPDMLEKCIEIMRDGWRGLSDQAVESERYKDLDTGLTKFSIAQSKRSRDNDIELHENQQLYSCGSLAPKLGRGGGCSSAMFKKASEPWELADGCMHLYAELTRNQTIQYPLHKLLINVTSATHVRHYVMHYAFLETVMKRLPEIAKNLGKRNFKPYLDDLLESILYSCECQNILAKAAGQNVLKFLMDYLGPNILRGRVENINPRYLTLVDQIEEDPMTMDVSHDPRGMAMEHARQPASQPKLGGTPT